LTHSTISPGRPTNSHFYAHKSAEHP
jgi:hypothetical protein